MPHTDLTPHFVGLDVHKQIIVACIVNQVGQVISQHQFSCSKEQIEHFARSHLRSIDLIVLEATTNT